MTNIIELAARAVEEIGEDELERSAAEARKESVIRQVDSLDRNGIIKAIKTALERRSGKKWSVTGGKGTAYGWITIEAPPVRRIQHCRLKEGATMNRPEDYESYLNPSKPGGSMTDSDTAELAHLLGKDGQAHHQGELIPSSSDYRREYLHRALYGTPGSFNAQPYWD